MNKKIALEDFRKNKLINISLLLFICLTAALISAVFLLSTSLFSSIDNLMDKAKSPDYLQMHQGEIDLAVLKQFAENHPNVREFQCLDFVNMEGEQIVINGQSQEGSVQDNGIVYQSPKFDYLLDLDNNVIEVERGEIYLPLMFYEDGTAAVGDNVSIAGKDFTLVGFFRDSQMNSNMAGSKRLLLNKEDFEEIRDEGTTEYLIEFLLHDRAKTSEFEKDYQNEVPYKNGVAVTYSMFKIINALNDGIMIAVLILATVLIMFIAMLCIRFTLTAKLEDEFLEIAVLKAIGVAHKDIKRIYLAIYLIIAAIGSILGYFLALLFQNTLLAGITLYMGKSDNARLAPVYALLGPVLVFLFFTVYLLRKLEAVKQIKPVRALRNGESGLSVTEKNQTTLKSKNLQSPVTALAFSDIWSKKSLYRTIVILIVLAVFLILVPLHIYTTVKDESFMNSLGLGSTDLSIDIQQVEGIEDKTENLLENLRQDSKIEQAESFTMKNIAVTIADEQSVYLKINSGDHEAFPIDYKMGRAPVAEGEIALSALYIDDLELEMGDEITLTETGKSMTIVGIYSDISNGGRTAKTAEELPGPILRNNIFVKVKKANDIDEVAAAYSEEYGFAKILTLREHADQAFGSMQNRLKSAALVAFTVSIAVIALVSSLFTKLLIAKDKRSLASLKALGFSSPDLQTKQLLSLGIVALAAVVIGILLANSLGGYIAGALVASFGVSSLRLVIQPVITYFGVPIAILALTLLAAYLVSRTIRGIKISDSIKE